LGLSFETRAGISDEQTATLTALATDVHAILGHLATDRGIPGFDVQIVVASDFADEVHAILRRLDGANGDGGEVFTTERTGGAVTGKCIPLTDDYSDQVIVLDGAPCTVDDPNGQAWFVSLLAHELAHAVIGRARHASGALEGVPRVSFNGVDRAKSIARIAAEEYRVDVISSVLLGGLGSVTDGAGAARPATAYDLLGDCHRDELRLALDTTVHPGWPDTVQRYREHQMPLEELWREISLSTEGVFTLVAHAEAHAALGATRSPWTSLPGTAASSSTWRRRGGRSSTRSAPRRPCRPWRPPAPTSSASPMPAAKRSSPCGTTSDLTWRSTRTAASSPFGSARRGVEADR
jgi:hypothetical protein